MRSWRALLRSEWRLRQHGVLRSVRSSSGFPRRLNWPHAWLGNHASSITHPIAGTHLPYRCCRTGDPVRPAGPSAFCRQIWRLNALGRDDLLDRLDSSAIVASACRCIARGSSCHSGRVRQALPLPRAGGLPRYPSRHHPSRPLLLRLGHRRILARHRCWSLCGYGHSFDSRPFIAPRQSHDRWTHETVALASRPAVAWTSRSTLVSNQTGTLSKLPGQESRA